MEGMFDVVASPSFRVTMYNISIFCLILVGVVIIFAFMSYGRAREIQESDNADTKWTLLFATWRDSLIVTVLFTGQSILYSYRDFSSFSETPPESILLYSPIITPILSLLLDVLILIVAAMRIFIISKWLAAARTRVP